MSAESFEGVVAAVSGWPGLTALHLGHCQSPQDQEPSLEKLSKSLVCCNALQALTVGGTSHCPVSQAVNLLLPPLCTNHAGLQHLDLGGGRGFYDRNPNISLLTELKSLTFLQIALSAYFPAGQFAGVLSQLCNLQQLHISHSQFGSSHAVARSLSALESLTVLNLANSGVDKNAMPGIARSLRSLCRLQHLDVSENFLPGCCVQLTDALATLPSLKSVKLSHVELCEGEAVECMTALAHLPALTLLDLNGSVSSREHDGLQGQCWVHAEHSGTSLLW